MNEEDKRFLENYEKLLNKGYCNCNEMNCIDNNSPQRILNIAKYLQQRVDKAKELCKIVLDSEDKNQDLLDHISGIYRELQGKE